MKVLMSKTVSLFCILALFFVGCQNSGDTGNKEIENEISSEFQQEIDSVAFFEEHNARNSLDYAGTYQGVLPCADCEGIAVEIRIFYDSSFEKSIEYLGKGAEAREFSGKYNWNDAGNTIALQGLELPNQYFVAEERLIHLDSDGQRISGDLADHYVLKKTY